MHRRSWPLLLIFALVSTRGIASAQASSITLDDAIRSYEAAAHTSFRGLPDDWTMHHVVFSHAVPGSRAAAVARANSRYWLQQIRQRMSAGIHSTALTTSMTPAAERLPQWDGIGALI
jgi:hypothetical protein